MCLNILCQFPNQELLNLLGIFPTQKYALCLLTSKYNIYTRQSIKSCFIKSTFPDPPSKPCFCNFKSSCSLVCYEHLLYMQCVCVFCSGITAGELPGCTRMLCPLPAHLKSIRQALDYYRALLAGMNAATFPDTLEKLGVKQLKSLLQELSVSSAGCLDRADLLETAKRACAMSKL